MNDPIIKAFVTNAGKYGEGDLCGEWLKLPATTEDVQSVLAKIGVDGAVYEEYFITAYFSEITGLQNLGEYERIDELNYLATLLDETSDDELEMFESAAEKGDHTGSVKDLINLVQNVESYELLPGIEDEDDLGRYLIEELGYEAIPDHLANYIDYKAYGRDFDLNGNGTFVDGGYIMDNGDNFTEYYSGREDIPEEYRVFAYPDPSKMNMKERLAMYGSMVTEGKTADRPAPAHEI